MAGTGGLRTIRLSNSNQKEQTMIKQLAKKLTITAVLAVIVSLMITSMSLAAGGNSGLKLHPSGFGPKSQATWKAQQGLPDSQGNANHALYLQKFVPTSTFAAGVAVVNGAEGMVLTGLEWEHRDDGHCGAGAPRWNVSFTDPSNNDGFVFLGCTAAAHTPGSAPGWTRDTFTAATLVTNGIPAGSTIRGLAIIFDEGTDQGQGYVYLDNIKVNDKVWTSPSDNGN
jgi:hypothetical protein